MPLELPFFFYIDTFSAAPVEDVQVAQRVGEGRAPR